MPHNGAERGLRDMSIEEIRQQKAMVLLSAKKQRIG